MRVLVLYGLLVLAGAPVYAERIIPPVVSSTARAQLDSNQVPVQIVVISREDIDDSGATSVADVLRGRGMVHVTDTFGNGTRPSIGMRGFGETANANTLILVDSRRLNNMDIASPDLNSLSLKDVERIEIIQGSASVLYGDQAVGGVINIITRHPGKHTADMQAGSGSYGLKSMQAGVSRSFDNGLYFRVSGERKTSDGYRDHNEFDYTNAFGLFGYEHSSGSLFVELQSIDEKLNTPGALYLDEARFDRRQARPEFRNDFIDTRTDVVRAGIEQQLNDNWQFKAEITGRKSCGEFLQSFRYFPETIPATQKRLVAGFNPRFIGDYDMNGGRLLITLGHDIDDSRYRLTTRFGPQNNDQYVSSWYGQVVFPFNTKTKVSYGVRRSEVENDLQDGGLFALYPAGIDINDRINVQELGVSYRWNNHWNGYARYAETFRFAKVDEYLTPFGGQVLENQTGVSREAGIEYSGKNLGWSLAVYELGLNNELAFDPLTFSNLNLDKTRRRGMNLNVSFRMKRAWRLSADYSYVDADVLSGTYAGNTVPMVSRHILRASVNYQPDSHWQFYGELQAVGERPYSGDFNNVLSELPGHGVINLKASYRIKGWQFEARINNVLNKYYSEFGARNDDFMLGGTFASVQPAPERNATLSMRYRFH